MLVPVTKVCEFDSLKVSLIETLEWMSSREEVPTAEELSKWRDDSWIHSKVQKGYYSPNHVGRYIETYTVDKSATQYFSNVLCTHQNQQVPQDMADEFQVNIEYVLWDMACLNF